MAFNILAFQRQGVAQVQTTVFGQSPAPAFSVPVRNGRCCGIFPVVTTETYTSLANPSGSPIVVNAIASGRSIATITVPARGQIIFSPSDLLPDSSLAVRFTSSNPFCIAGLQDLQIPRGGTITGPFGVEAIPDSTGPSPLLVLPHLVLGPYSSSIYAFKNSDIQSSTDELEFFSQEGEPADIAGLGRQ
jgi:hypothetical protein